MSDNREKKMKKFIAVIICALFFAAPAFSARGGRLLLHNNRSRISLGIFYPDWYGYGWNSGFYNPVFWSFDYYGSFYYRAQRERAAREEILALEQRRAAAEETIRILAGVKAEKAKFYKKYFSDRIPESMAEITVFNGSQYDGITKIYFRGVITTHITGKTIIDDTFSYALPVPLPRLRSATYKIPLNAFGGWAKLQTPPDLAIFTVSVEGIETAGGAVLRADAFSADDQKRLERLQRRF